MSVNQVDFVGKGGNIDGISERCLLPWQPELVQGSGSGLRLSHLKCKATELERSLILLCCHYLLGLSEETVSGLSKE